MFRERLAHLGRVTGPLPEEQARIMAALWLLWSGSSEILSVRPIPRSRAARRGVSFFIVLFTDRKAYNRTLPHFLLKKREPAER